MSAQQETVDLTTDYLGLKLKSPLVVSASPVTTGIETVRLLEEAGAGAAVMPSLFEEQIEAEELALHHMHEFQTETHAESLTYFPELDDYNTGPDGYLRHLAEVKRITSLPIIGSLNGSTTGGWVRFASLMEQAGADALELNIYLVPTEPGESSQRIEQRYVNIVQAVRQQVNIPLAVKIGPFVTALPHFAAELFAAGADGLVLFNRYLEPDIHLEEYCVQPTLELSNPSELRLALRWLGILRDQTDKSLAATGGVHEVEDVVKAIAVGADVVMLASALLSKGWRHMQTLYNGLQQWLQKQEYQALWQLKGSISRLHSAHPEAFQRANYTKAITSFCGDFI